MLEKERASERQQLLSQVSKTKEESDIAIKRFDLLLEENRNLVRKCQEIEHGALDWQSKEAKILEELNEARACASNNVAPMRERIRSLEQQIEVMRKDHTSLLQQSHMRQDQLEASNQELGSSLADAQRALEKMKSGADRADRNSASTREMEDLRQQVPL